MSSINPTFGTILDIFNNTLSYYYYYYYYLVACLTQ